VVQGFQIGGTSLKHQGVRMRKLALMLLAGCGLFQTGMGLYFVVLRPTMLPEDERFIGVKLDTLAQMSTSIPVWLDRVFIVLGGHAVATGLLVMLTAILLGLRPISLTALAFIATAGSASVGLMSAMNFAIHSDFRWLLLLPALVWAGAALLLAGEWIGQEADARLARDPESR
jgi:hypothetical protein